MNRELFIKYFNNHCSQSEIDEILNWIRQDVHGLSDHVIVEQIWKDYLPDEQFDERKLEQMLDKVHHRINISQAEKSGNVATKGRMFYTIGRIFMRAAAILFIPVLAWLIYIYKNPDIKVAGKNSFLVDTIEIIAPVGSRTYIELADGTGVYLNHGSKLRYPQKFMGKNRIVELTGEGYFKIASDPEKPFQVETSCLLITAKGTEFNVMAYPDESYVETTLVEGKVLVEKKKAGSLPLKVCEMEPDHHLRFYLKNNTYRYETADPGKYISWKDGILIFRNDRLDEIASRLSRWYNVEFIFRNEKVKEFPYTATFVDETLPQILDLLRLATPISYEMTSRIKLPDGSFSKPKVFIDVKRN